MDKDTEEGFETLEQENKQLIKQVRDQSKYHLTPNEELKKGVTEDLVDTILGDG